MSQKPNWKKNDKATQKSKFETPRGNKKVYIDIRGKSESQSPCNHDIIYFHYLRLSRIASQYLSKKVMILHDHEEVKIIGDSDAEKMLSIEDANDDEVEYPVEGESFMVRLALSAQIKQDELEQQMKNTFHIGCHINNKTCNMIIDDGVMLIQLVILVWKF